MNQKNLPTVGYMIKKANMYPTRSIRAWGRWVNEAWNYRCCITGRTQEETHLQRHHLYSSTYFPFLKLEPLNGILLSKDIHLQFHSLYGNNIKPIDFIYFLENLEETDQSLSSDHLRNLALIINTLDTAIKDKYSKNFNK